MPRARDDKKVRTAPESAVWQPTFLTRAMCACRIASIFFCTCLHRSQRQRSAAAQRCVGDAMRPQARQEQLPQDRGFAQNLAMGTRGRLCPLDSIGEPAGRWVGDRRTDDDIRVVLMW